MLNLLPQNPPPASLRSSSDAEGGAPMRLQSMTGFARTEGRVECGAGSGKWTWELRSVNSKGLEVRFRLPPGFEGGENEFRRAIGARLTRGNIQAALQFERDAGDTVPVINQAALEAVLAAISRIGRELGSPPPAAEAILQIRGVMETGEGEVSAEELEVRNSAVMNGLAAAADALVKARSAEGKSICAVLAGHVDAISALVDKVEGDPSRTPEAIRERLQGQLAVLLADPTGIDPQRLHQEAAILATKADLREEIDRLRTHVQAARTLLSGPGPAGRKLDFLAQEFNRECNTICSKSNAAAVTTCGLEMKVLIDQFREQVQNIE
jgi:uncharacterized protein (TIGR00255 family)